MATISALAVRLSLNAAGFNPATVEAASNITHIGNAAIGATSKLRGLNQEAEKSEGIFQRVTKAVKDNAHAILGLAAGGSIAFSIKAAADAEEKFYANIQEHIGATQTLTVLLGNLKSTVTEVYAAFGQAFIDASNLKGGIVEITNVANTLKPIAAGIGGVLGTMASWFISLGRAILPVIAAFKIFGVVVGIAFKVTHALLLLGIARWIAGFLGLRIGALLFQGAMLAVRAGFIVATYAAAIFHAATGPTGWAILAGAVAVSAAAVYGLGKAYEYAATNAREAIKVDGMEDATAAADALAAAADAAKAAADALAVAYKSTLAIIVDAFGDVRKEINTLGMSEGAKKVYELRNKLLAANREAGISQHLTAEQNDALDYLQTRYDELEVRKSMLKITEEIAHVEKEAAQASMTKGQKMLDDLARMGATRQQLAEAQGPANAIDAAEWAKQQATERKAMESRVRSLITSDSPFEKFKQQAEEIRKLAKVGAINPAEASRALNAAGKGFIKGIAHGDTFKLESPKAMLKGTAEAELAADRARTPIEKLTEIQQKQLREAEKIARSVDEQFQWQKNNGMQVAQF